jgi:hypothetical protein
VRWVLIPAVFALVGCGPGLVFNESQEMTPDQMLQRADHIFIGVIEKHSVEALPFFRVPGQNPGDWTVLRRRIRVENVLRGSERRKEIDIYEIFWTGPTSGDWNLTQNDQRYLFLVRTENGRYHVVRDWWRSIFRISSGRHERLPLDASRPFWERVGLLMWQVGPGWSPGIGDVERNDPGQILGRWRAVKLLRGLLRYPNHELQLTACASLLAREPWEDECWDRLTAEDQHRLADIGAAHRRHKEAYAQRRTVAEMFAAYSGGASDLDRLRLLTTENNAAFRLGICRLFVKRFPVDHDNGCPADKPPPATIVTEDGDLPLTGPWPTGK